MLLRFAGCSRPPSSQTFPEMTKDYDNQRRDTDAIRDDSQGLQKEQPLDAALVSVVIPCYNQAHFLGEAIESVLAQSYPHFEVVVVDDGSTDNTSEVAARYPGVRCVRQDNQGLAAARNSGIAHSKGEYLVFLDADDRLLPHALEVGVESLEAHPECAFVSGRYRNIAADGSIRLDQPHPRTIEDPYLALLQGNYIGMHAAVMYRRAALKSVGGFDTSLNASEDYDMYFRIAKNYPVRSHRAVVAEYRGHDANMGLDSARLLRSSNAVLRSQRVYIKRDRRYKEAYKTGVKSYQAVYGVPLARKVVDHVLNREWKLAMGGLLLLARYYPHLPVDVWRKLSARFWRKLSARFHAPRVGHVNFGYLRRLTPISGAFGFDRGQPIDRYYIENFLARESEAIRGRVLEIQSAAYTRKYGGSRVEVSDVLDIEEDNLRATIVGDLTDAPHIPSGTFDCIICTQTLQLIYEVRSAVLTLHRILKPGGILLVTVPGISQIENGALSWYWSFTAQSVRRLSEEAFPGANPKVEPHGNVLSAISFLHGLSAQELTHEELDYRDPQYEVLITLRVMKPETTL